MYKVGMYGGSFDPLHIGHVQSIVKAMSMCDELHIILSYSKSQDKIDYKQRYQWLVQVTKDMPNVVLHAVEYQASTKEEYNWDIGTNDIKDSIGKHIDVVFCGSDYREDKTFENLYKDSTIIYLDRKITPITSTKIRQNPMKYWEYIPNVVRPYYVKKVLIVGGESTGKSTLTRNLANSYNTVYVEEVGRTVCEKAQSEEMMLEQDFYEIMIKHKAREFEQTEKANKMLFIDTDCLTTMFYGQLLYGGTLHETYYNTLATIMSKLNKYDLILFLTPEVDFVQDGTRNENIKAERKKYSNILKNILIENNLEFVEVGGDYNSRLTRARELVNKLIGGNISC